jgi:hypothetical protein
VVAAPSTGFLFFLRVRAIFHKTRIVVGLFFVLWLATLAASFLLPFGLEGIHIGTTQYCINHKVAGFAGAGTVANTIHGTLVFLAISWKLLSMSNESSRMKAFVKGQSSSRISSVVLTSGQLYYLWDMFVLAASVVPDQSHSATVGLNIVTLAMIYAPTVPAFVISSAYTLSVRWLCALISVFHAMFAIPNVALENAMACRVFRILKFDAVRSSYIDTIVTETSAPRSHQHRSANRTNDPEAGSHALVDFRPTQITITKEVQNDSLEFPYKRDAAWKLAV